MKLAKAIPVIKFDEKNVFTNYRPGLLLQQFSKYFKNGLKKAGWLSFKAPSPWWESVWFQDWTVYIYDIIIITEKHHYEDKY